MARPARWLAWLLLRRVSCFRRRRGWCGTSADRQSGGPGLAECGSQGGRPDGGALGPAHAIHDEPPKLDLNKLGNKGLTGLQLNLKDRLWSGGGYFLSAFFVAACFMGFAVPATNHLRWVFTAALVLLVAGQPFLNSGESLRLPVYYLLPVLLVFGAGFLLCPGREQSGDRSTRAPGGGWAAGAAGGAPGARPHGTAALGISIIRPITRRLFMRIHADITLSGGLQAWA